MEIALKQIFVLPFLSHAKLPLNRSRICNTNMLSSVQEEVWPQL